MGTIPPYIPASEPTIKDLLDAHKKDILLSTNCHAIGTVQTFELPSSFPGLPTITATMNYTKSFTVELPGGGFTNQVSNYPALVACPAIVLGGGLVSAQMPVAKGDQCLILFNDRDLSGWWASPNGGASALPSCRLHSFSDGIALVGFKNWLVNDPVRMLFTNGNVSLGLNPVSNKVTVSNETNGTPLTLNGALQALITAVKAITVTTSVPSTPGSYTSGTPNNAADLTAAANTLAGLLE